MDATLFVLAPHYGGLIQLQKIALLNGADFVLAGMFDYEIDEDVKIAIDALGRTKDRERAWKA